MANRLLYRQRCPVTYLWLVKYADNDELYGVYSSVFEAANVVLRHNRFSDG